MDCPTSSAIWSKQIDEEFLRHYQVVAAKPHMVASGGKSLKATGWNAILYKMKNIGNITSTEQLKTRWRRMKEEYSDYHWLMTQHSGGGRVGITSEQGEELDQRNKKHKLSRFRYNDFPYYSILQRILGDTIATGSEGGEAQETLNGSEIHDEVEVRANLSSSEDGHDDMNAPSVLTTAKKRAKLINDAMKASKKRRILENDEKMKLRKQNVESIKSIAQSISSLVQIIAAKNNVQAFVEDNNENM
ncbi:hypothetical protein AC1031_014106 [Aphanomyces cochlioides]|nr:hypothetical protein AC1031_014106 [Aphanomyces cochlioides]